MADPPDWWRKTTIYHIYPRSFCDASGDGIGDLRGILGKLDYLQELGVETLWLSPFFASAQEDLGYDVTDYLDIAPEYGTHDDGSRSRGGLRAWRRWPPNPQTTARPIPPAGSSWPTSRCSTSTP